MGTTTSSGRPAGTQPLPYLVTTAFPSSPLKPPQQAQQQQQQATAWAEEKQQPGGGQEGNVVVGEADEHKHKHEEAGDELGAYPPAPPRGMFLQVGGSLEGALSSLRLCVCVCG